MYEIEIIKKQSFSNRLKEHYRDISQNKKLTALAKFCTKNRAEPEWNNIRFSSICTTEKIIQIHEAIRIYETRVYNVNESETVVLSPPWKLIIQENADDRKRKLKGIEHKGGE